MGENQLKLTIPWEQPPTSGSVINLAAGIRIWKPKVICSMIAAIVSPRTTIGKKNDFVEKKVRRICLCQSGRFFELELAWFQGIRSVGCGNGPIR